MVALIDGNLSKMITMKKQFNSPLLTRLAERLAPLPCEATAQPYAVLIAITNEPAPKVLYSLRAPDMRQHAGEVSFAGGRREPFDDSNHATALREAFEETGILSEQVTILGELPLHHAKNGSAVVPVVGLIAPDVVLTPQVGEIARLFWADLATLIEQVPEVYVKDYGTMRLQSPAFIIDGETVWGLTGRMTATLLNIAFDRQIDWQFNVSATNQIAP